MDRSAASGLPLPGEKRIVTRDAPTRACERCGSVTLGLVAFGSDYLRKECLTCGSTGPFIPLPKDGPHGY